ncbi:MAG TPA: GtrA family protein [Polyangiaceae bacterium]|nr:GtrA family protein [Polyangiaceae bacterium]
MGRLGGSRLHSNTAIHRPLKSALANAAATAVDFAVATTLVYATLVHPAIATAVGCTVGAATSFALSRSWAFEAAKGAMLQQVVRYGAISLVTMALNAGGVALLLLIQVQFIAAWVVTRCLIFATWSYPLQRDFVFAASDVAMTSVAVPVPEPSGVSNQ